ncbi:MAG: putative Ig domain-containing protein [Steroidobacteraceae bacterium]
MENRPRFSATGQGSASAVTPAGSGGSTNGKPSISGQPQPEVKAGESYSFQPTASDPDGDALTFRIENRPPWAQFDPATGRLYGIPGDGDVGSHEGIRILVSDGQAEAGTPQFAVNVTQIALGSATLSWTPPTQNSDGSTLLNLAGYRIYYGQSPSQLTEQVVINSAGLSTYVIENLSPATWYFSMTAVNSSGVESERSSTVSKQVG